MQIEIKDSRVHLHYLLEKACDRTKEGDFVAAHFVEICMEELEEKIKSNKFGLKS